MKQLELVEEEGRRWQQECERMDARISELEEEQEAYTAKVCLLFILERLQVLCNDHHLFKYKNEYWR